VFKMRSIASDSCTTYLLIISDPLILLISNLELLRVYSLNKIDLI
jgi:hypothetical protein